MANKSFVPSLQLSNFVVQICFKCPVCKMWPDFDFYRGKSGVDNPAHLTAHFVLSLNARVLK